MQRPGQRQDPILDGLAQPDIHSHQVVEVELLQKKEMGNIGQNGYWHCRHISRVYVLFTLLVSAQSCQGHTEAGSLTLDTRVAATIFHAAAVGSELGHADRFAKFSRTKKD